MSNNHNQNNPWNLNEPAGWRYRAPQPHLNPIDNPPLGHGQDWTRRQLRAHQAHEPGPYFEHQLVLPRPRPRRSMQQNSLLSRDELLELHIRPPRERNRSRRRNSLVMPELRDETQDEFGPRTAIVNYRERGR